MKPEIKQKVKKTIETASSAALGGVAGAALGAVVTPESAQAAETEPIEVVDQTTPAPTPAAEPNVQSRPATQQATEQHTGTNAQTSETGPETSQQGSHSGEVEVLSYDRVTDDTGQQVDIAVVSVDGQEMGFVDVNLDGEADLMLVDYNSNGELENSEIINVQAEGIAMQPLQETAGFNPDYAQNDMPDYVNDANTDTYMA